VPAWVASFRHGSNFKGLEPRIVGQSNKREFRSRVQLLGMNEVITAPRSPWQNAFVERLIGSIRRECLDHMIILSQRHPRHLLKNYLTYYHRSRTHLALAKDAPEPRAIMRRGEIIAIPQVGGLHHRYERRAE
jgi:putative transposase